MKITTKMRKYRIIEKKYKHISHFYPQYRDENDAHYVLGRDKNDNGIKSEYKYFGSWKEHSPGISHWEKDLFYDLSNARRRIEIDIKQRTAEELAETIIHEF